MRVPLLGLLLAVAAAQREPDDAALRDLIDRKRKNSKTPRAKTGGDGGAGKSGENVVDLMSALKESLKKDGARKKPAASSRRKKSA